MNTNKLKEKAKEAVKSLIQHYSQDIHHETSSSLLEPAANNESNNYKDKDDVAFEAPYFDDLLGHPRVISPVIGYWKDKILSFVGNHDDDHHPNEKQKGDDD
eukprot:7668588-Ditylum_brightwellii.AAC.1